MAEKPAAKIAPDLVIMADVGVGPGPGQYQWQGGRVRATMGCRQFRLARFQAERIPVSLSGSAADGFTFTMAANRRQRPAAA